MKILQKNLDKNKGGVIEFIPEEEEDLWHLYNLICIGDNVRCSTMRKFQKETNTGSISSERVKLNLTIRVKKIDFDSVGGVLRLSGKNVCENRYVKIGQFHTLQIVINKKMSISKRLWDKIDLERVDVSSNATKTAELAAVVMEKGLAHICLITSFMTIVRQKIETGVPKKRFISSHQKGMEKFFKAVLMGICRNIDFNVVKCLIIGSPGFLKDQFKEYAIKNSHQPEFKVIQKNLKKFLLVHTNSGQKQALKEVLADQVVIERMKNTKAMEEVKSLNLFFKMLNEDEDKAIFGPKPVKKANDQRAVEVLLITDSLFRSSRIKERKKFVSLVDDVKAGGGKVYIFSSMHVSGEQLDQISGIAAILRFPLPSVYDSDSDE